MWDLHILTPCPASSTRSCALLALKEDALLANYSCCASNPLTSPTKLPSSSPVPLQHRHFSPEEQQNCNPTQWAACKEQSAARSCSSGCYPPSSERELPGSWLPWSCWSGIARWFKPATSWMCKTKLMRPQLELFFCLLHKSNEWDRATPLRWHKFFLPVTFLIRWVLSVHSQHKQTGSQNDSQDWGSSCTFYGRFISLLLLTQPLLSIRKSRVLDLPCQAGQSSEHTTLTLAKRPSLLHTSGGKTKQN